MGTAATLAGIGSAFAWSMMKAQGWSDGDGLGKNRQGRKTAIKPKLKFDSHGLGHDRSEEFEFHWWDHLFNSAAKGVTVNEPGEGGEITVSFIADKSERSAKKLRRKMQKEMKNQLYSRFVKSGTLKGETLISEETKEDVVTQVEDLGKIKTLSDDDLIKACGGRTAHKGARHGHKMSAKQLRLEAAEAAFIASMQQKETDKQKKNESKELKVKYEEQLENIETTNKKKKKSKSDKIDEDTRTETSSEEEPVSKKRKKDKKEKVLSDSNVAEDLQPISEEPSTKKRKKDKKDKTNDLESTTDIITEPLENLEQPAKKKKKKDKKEKENLEEDNPVIEISQENATTDDNANITKKKKKSKKKSKDNEIEA